MPSTENTAHLLCPINTFITEYGINPSAMRENPVLAA